MDFDPRWPDDERNRDQGREFSQRSRGGVSDPRERASPNPRDVFMKDLKHLKREGLVQTIPVRGPDRALVVLTEKGRDVLETNRRSDGVRREVDDRYLHDDRNKVHDRGPRQEFHHGLRRPRERTHDAQVYRAYERDADRLREDDAMICRVILDNELKREHQEFLLERNRGRSGSDGRPDRSPEEIRRWAVEHDLPEKDGHVQLPDARIEYEDRDGRLLTLDIEVETINYRGGHAAAKASSGFSRHSGSTMRVVSVNTSGRKGGRGFDPRVAEELLR